MHGHVLKDDATRRKRRVLLAVVGLGISLFVSGFLVTVASLSGPSAASSGEAALQATESASGDSSVSLLLGLLVSLGGVVLATAGPLMMFVFVQRGPVEEARGPVE